ncbi:Fc.00g100970.m01.CDS01 [Cosmosporella sp. VM-42]
MASSRSSSPVDGGSPEPLTPGSKIQALLATVESSDEEGSPSANANKSQSQKPTRSEQQHNDAPRLPEHHDEGSEESDVEIRPRGKLASRMQGITHSTESKTNNTTETARDRVKKSLQREQDEKVEKMREVDMADAEDEEDDLPVLPRRRLQRKEPTSPILEAVARESRSPSPGLFVSSPIRPSPSKSTHNNSDSEDNLPTLKSNRFKALVEQKRQERLAREAVEEARNAERRALQEKAASELKQFDSDNGNVSDITDDEGGRRLTQGVRPTRKASKKAIEEINRETQRMARNMQLAHEAKTRKKISKNALFERFNFRQPGDPESKMSSSSRAPTPHSDVEMRDADTPPSSPPVAKKAPEPTEPVDAECEDEELPSLDDVLGSTKITLDKGKGKAVDIPEEREKPATKPKRHFRVKLPPMSANLTMFDSDDELEITKTVKTKIDAVFDSIPAKQAQESHSLQALRALAQVRSPGKETRRRDDSHRMTVGELQTFLQQKARQQAKLERDRRLQTLKAQGVVVQTAEERERQMQEVEDIVAKAREEAEKIMQEERADAKREKKENGEVDPLAWDDSDDEEYEDPANEADGEASAVELSGSEEEDEEGGESEDEDEEVTGGNALFEEEADDAESEVSAGEIEQTVQAGEDVDEDVEEPRVTNKRRARKHVTIISDDEDDEEDSIEATPKPKTKLVSPAAPRTVSPAVPTSVLRSAKKTFIPGLPVQGPAGLGLTQIFAGTMDDSQMGPASGPTQSMMPDFDSFPDSNFSATLDDPEDMILDSQKDETQKTTQGIQLNFSQSQMRGLDSLLREESYTQFSEIIEPSQDGGFLAHTPIKDRFIEPPHSTLETVMVSQHEDPSHDSPLVRRGRLRRRMETPLRIEETPEPVSMEKTSTAFNALTEGAKQERKRKLLEEFNRKKSKAKEMVEEQADESEDEYAGLGGADGEESDNESIASVKEMIDDAAGNDLDEAKLAAFYADRERANDEKQVEKLFKDITTGMLRRKRGADYDLSDSDDGGEARRRMKRRQFAKMQKALFSDERVKKIAENPGNQAFLRTIEDRGSDDEMDFLDPVDEQSEQSQSQEDGDARPQTIPDSQPRKPLASAGENRPPAPMRRTKDGKKPSNIGEVRETLSNLLEEPHGSVIPATEAGSDSEGEENPASPTRSDKENQNPRRTYGPVVDRISLKRNSSSMSSTSASTRLAFTAATSSATFKVPALLRRATTNSLKSGSTASTGSSTPTGGFGEEGGKIRKTASKKSGINAFARDSERRARLQQSERRREERKVRGAERRMGVVGGLLGKGTFE